MRRRCELFVVLFALVLWLAADPVWAGVDEGRARVVPWSGSYWPMRQGGLIAGPLHKYDYLTDRNAAGWEREKNPPGPEVPAWFGYCHAWAASAVTDRQPIEPRRAAGTNGRRIALSVGDQKGMLTACHTQDVAQHYGVRYNGADDEDPLDIYPDELWHILKLYIKQQGVPLIMDIESGKEVWNYPVYAYRVEYQPAGGANQYSAKMTLWMADDAVPPDYIGVKVSKQTYYFTFDLRNGSAVLGTGRWIGPSIKSHPDFAWYPYITRAENPEVDYDQVQRLLGTGQLIGSSSAERTDSLGSTASGANGGRVSIPPNRVPAPNDGPTTGGGNGGRLPIPPNYLPAPGAPASPAAGSPTAPPAGYSAEFPAGNDGPDAAAGQQPYHLSPVELLSLVTNRTSSFTCDITVDKFDGGHYTVGEPIRMRGTVAKDCFLYLFYIDSQGEMALLFPLAGADNRIASQSRFELPRPGGAAVFRAAAAYGTHRIKAIASTRPLVLCSGFAATPIPDDSQEQSQHFQQPTMPPSQRKLMRDVLTDYQRHGAVEPAALAGVSPQQLIGPFGQDEVAFYVGPVR